MQYGIAISALLHIGILIVALLGLPSLLNPDQAEIVPITVEVVTADQLDPKPAPEPEREPELKPEPPAPEPPKPVEAPKPPPPAPEPAPPQEAALPPEPAPPTPEPEPKPAPPEVKAPEPVPEPAPKPKERPEPPKPKPEPAKAPEPEPEPPQEAAAPPAPTPKAKPAPPPDEFQSLLKNLAKEKQQAEKQQAQKPKPQKTQQATSQANDARQRSDLEKRMIAASLAQAVIRQVSPCWNIPAGAKDAANMSVAIRIRLNPDGALGAQPRIEDTGRMSSDPFFRAVAESALRALRNPSCMPLKLPFDQYDMWKDITFVFDPREALGQ